MMRERIMDLQSEFQWRIEIIYGDGIVVWRICINLIKLVAHLLIKSGETYVRLVKGLGRFRFTIYLVDYL